MKTILFKLKKIRLALITVSILSSSSLMANSGGDHSGGGNSYSQEVITAGYQILDFIKANHTRFPDLPINKIERRLETLNVEFRETLLLNEMPQHSLDAINEPANNRILIKQSSWERLRKESSQKSRLGLVMHELFGISGIEGSNLYTVSAKILTQMLPNEITKNNNGTFCQVSLYDYYGIKSIPKELAPILNYPLIPDKALGSASFVALKNITRGVSSVLMQISSSRAIAIRGVLDGTGYFRMQLIETDIGTNKFVFLSNIVEITPEIVVYNLYRESQESNNNILSKFFRFKDYIMNVTCQENPIL
ncbi:MAG: hypothetical protein AAB116_27145 [Candidatus Poribacteria bacterium]